MSAPSSSSANASVAKAASSGSGGGNGRYIWIGAIVLVLVVGVVAVIASRDSNSDATTKADKAAEEESVRTVVTQPDSTDSTLAPLPQDGTDPAVGQTIPEVSGTTLDGKPITIGPDGKPKVIMFVAHWCPHCQREVPLIAAHLKETGMPDGVELVAVSTAVAEERGNYPPKAWLDREGWEIPTMADSADSSAAKTYGLPSFPYFLAVDADGKVVYRTTGEISVDQFDQLVDAARTGTAPTS